MAINISITDSEIDLLDFLLKSHIRQTGLKCNKNKCLRLIEKINQKHKTIKVSSRKAKGRNLQKWTVERIAELLGETLSDDKDSNDIRSREMGQSGTDVWLHKRLRNKFPIAIECKAQEVIKLNTFIEQAQSNTSAGMPYWLLVLKNKIIKNPIVVMDWQLLAWLYNFK